MKITRRSPVSGKENTLDLAITIEQWHEYKAGKHAQDAFPGLNDDEREFIISGTYPGEWDQMFGPDNEYYEEEEPENYDAYDNFKPFGNEQ